MESHFVTLTQDQFIEWAGKAFHNYKLMLPASGRELVIQGFLQNGFEIHVYTTVENGVSRDKGDDAIRCVLYDPKGLLGIGSEKKVLRSEGATTPFERLNERVLALKELASVQTLCHKCGAHKTEKKNSRDGSSFLGCCNFPACSRDGYDPAKMRRTHALRDPSSTIKPRTTAESRSEELRPAAPPVVNLVIPETDLCEDNELVPTSEYPFQKYNFPFFNRVQSTILKKVGHSADCNLVLGTSTSSGKTVSAEIFMGSTLDSGKTVVYVSPLKSLTQEKYDDWSETFSDKKICILTGDYVMTPQREKEINEADIICLTSEMVDSRTRKADMEKSAWFKKVGLLIVDESHIISTNRGHAVEAGLIRFSTVCPTARILLLSATMPNVADFQEWLTILNGKKTEVINSTWRPTQLDWNFVEHASGAYAFERDQKMNEALMLVQHKPDEKFLVFVHDKNTGRMLVNLFKENEVEAEFLNADLSMQERQTIEQGFRRREGGDRVLVTTSVVAWGSNLPARNVVIVGTVRGINEVDELDIIQMAGRAGRFGIDPKGDVFLICKNSYEWSQRVKRPRDVTSTLIEKGILGFHILAEIKTGSVYNKATLEKWFDRTLARIQLDIPKEMVEEVLRDLEFWGMMVVTEIGYYKVTRLGRVSADLYYFPADIFHWSVAFGRVNSGDLWNNDLAIAYSLGTVPSWQMNYIPKEAEERVRRFTQEVAKLPGFDKTYSSVIAADAYDLLVGHSTSLSMRNVQYDAPRICQTLAQIDRVKGWKVPEFWNTLQLRIKYGAPAEIAQLCAIPGIGVARAKKLNAGGITKFEDFLEDKNHRKIGLALGDKLANQAIKFVRADLRAHAHDGEEE